MHDLSHAMPVLSRIGAACFISKTCKIGIPSRIRTGVDGVKIHYPRPLDDGDIMAEAVRFELTGPVGPSVFKTDGLNHSPTLPCNCQRAPQRSVPPLICDFVGFAQPN